MRKFAIFLFLAAIPFIFPKSVNSQQCINGGVECCVLVNGQCRGDTFPGNCNSNCVGTCPSNGFDEVRIEEDNCHWEGQPPSGGGGGGGSCRQARVDCPAGTTRGSTVVSSTCQVVNGLPICGGIGSAQRTFSDSVNCCNWIDPPRVCCPWHSCPPRKERQPLNETLPLDKVSLIQ